MSQMIRRYLPLGLLTTIIVIVTIQYYLSIQVLKDLSSTILNWAVIMATIAVGLGIINILTRYMRNISRRRENWIFNLWTIIVIIMITATGLIYPFGSNSTFNWLLTNLYLPGDSSIYAMVFFDICFAFWRAFKVRNTDAAILLIAAFFVMLYNAPLTQALFPQIAPFGKWLFDNPATAANRGIGLVIAIGTLAYSFRILMQRETGAVGIRESTGEE